MKVMKISEEEDEIGAIKEIVMALFVGCLVEKRLVVLF